MKATGVCHTDLNFSKEKTIPGLFPAVFGHEGGMWRLPNTNWYVIDTQQVLVLSSKLAQKSTTQVQEITLFSHIPAVENANTASDKKRHIVTTLKRTILDSKDMTGRSLIQRKMGQCLRISSDRVAFLSMLL
jgi:hypothetical protein